MGDSLDLVVVGAYYGKGKRTNWYGAFLLACYDPDSENFQTICKIGTGFSEELLKQFYDELHPLELTGGARGNIEVGGAKPDVWFEPKVVWEVLTADLSLSPVYTAAHGLVSTPTPRYRLTVRLTNAASLCASRGSSKCATTSYQRRRRYRSRWVTDSVPPLTSGCRFLPIPGDGSRQKRRRVGRRLLVGNVQLALYI